VLLEGLEISEIFYSQIHQENRYDSEYYQKAYVANEKELRKKPFFQIGEQFYVTDGEHGSVIEQEFGIKYLTAENIKNGYVDISNVRYVSNEVDRKNARARVSVEDVLISIKGTLGAVAVAEEWLLPANMNRDVAILKPLLNKELSKVTALFLMSKYGLKQSSRGGSGGVQQMITLERLRKFIAPTFSKNFSLALNDLFQKTKQLRVQSQASYSQVETLLLETLGLADFSPCTEKVNIKSFKDSFVATGRLDAEHYQPKYEQIEEKIKAYSNGFATLGEISPNPTNGVEIREYCETGTPYLRIGDINQLEINEKSLAYVNQNAAEALMSKVKLKEGDVLMSRSGSLGVLCVVEKQWVHSLISSHLIILRIEDAAINSYFLALFLSSIAGKLQIVKNSNGGVQPEINHSALKSILIPKLDMETQTQIATLVQESFALKAESGRLLDVAKRAVEIAIEIDEQAAMAYLERQI